MPKIHNEFFYNSPYIFLLMSVTYVPSFITIAIKLDCVFLEKNLKKCKNPYFQGISLCLGSICPISFISIVMKLGTYVIDLYKKIYGKFQNHSLCILGKMGRQNIWREQKSKFLAILSPFDHQVLFQS